MDGSALLALGILVEEAVKEELGKDGDLVFVEGEGGGDEVEMTVEQSRRHDQSTAKAPKNGSQSGGSRGKRKRRRIGETGLER